MQSIRSMEQEYQGELRVKKPSKLKRKPARGTTKSRTPSQSKAARMPRTRKPRATAARTPKRSRPRRASSVRTRLPRGAEAYSADERQALFLLLAPFVVMTIAVGMSQALMQTGAAMLQVAHVVGPAAFLREVSPLELASASAGPVEVPTPSATRHAATAVRPSVVVEASMPPALLDASPAPVPLEASQSFVRLEASSPPATLEAPLPVEVAAPAASLGMLSRCKAPWTIAAKPPLKSVAFVDSAEFGRKLARAARTQTRDLVIYTDKYQTISFPLGDVRPMYGVCTDVVIRAYRALGIDLQVLVHKARLGTGDPSIDHRRTKTLRRFFARHGVSIPVTEFPEDYQPGDIVTYHQPLGRGSQLHIAIVSNVIAASGRPMIVHNRGWGPQIEDALFFNEVTGHYRYSGPAQEQKTTTVLSAR